MKNILVTGAGGYLGTELIKQLMKTENKIYALTSNKLKIEKRFGSSVICFSNDELFAEKSFLSEIDIVVHCAFARGHNGEDLRDSIHFTKEVFLLATDNNCSIINISSRSVYGQNPNTPWTENSKLIPDSLYALAKYSSELLAETIAKYKVVFTNIRLAGLLAPTFEDRIVNKFIHYSISNKEIKIVGGKQQFAFLDVRDAAAGIIALLNIPFKNWKQIYNLGYLKSYTIKEIAETVKQVAKDYHIDVEIKKEPSDAILYAELDSTKLYQDTKWQPQYNMEQIVRSIFEEKIKKL